VAPVVIPRLAAHDGEHDTLELGGAVAELGVRALQHVRVEGAAQAAVRRDDHELQAPDPLARLEQRVLGERGAPRDLRQRRLHALGVRARVHDRVLRAAQLGRGDHAHRPRDLLGLADALDAPPDVLQARHLATG
jgi:hypothetical protein